MRIKLVLKLLFVFIISSCNNKTAENSKSFDEIVQIDSTKLLTDSVSQSKNLNYIDKEKNEIKKGDVLFLDYRFGMSQNEINEATKNLLKRGKIRKVGDKLLYDISIDNKTIECDIYLNNQAQMLPNRLFAVSLSSSYYPFGDVEPKFHQPEKIINTLKVSNVNYALVKKLYTSKYGAPKESKYEISNQSRSSKIVFEVIYKDLNIQIPPNMFPKDVIFENNDNIINLSVTSYGGPNISYYSKRFLDKISKQEAQKNQSNEKKTLEDI